MIASFRDPAGSLLIVDGRVIRIIKDSAETDLKAFLATKTLVRLLEEGKVVRTNFLGTAETRSLSESDKIMRAVHDSELRVFVEHERIAFTSFPYEWPPEMLYAAADLTLELAQTLLADGIGLKDATPYNVLYRGAQPIFIDVLSFERRDPNDPTWLPFAQFSRTFLLPLLVNKHFGIKLDQIFLTNRDGLDPEEVEHLCGPLQRIRSPFLTLITLPARLSRRPVTADASIYQKQVASSPEKAQFILEQMFKSLRRKLTSLRPVESRSSSWSDYMEKNRYSEDYFALKENFVEQALREVGPRRVLDAGCNTGYFSALAARAGASVVAIDYDPVVIGSVWRKASAEKLDILPLVVNLARPTPSLGWRNAENPSFLERARGAFDGMLMLAVLHHMLVSERIPLPEIMQLASEISSDLLVIEYIPPGDPMFRCIARGRDHLHTYLNRDHFEGVARRFFDIKRSERLGDTDRWIYMMRRKQVA